MQKSYISWKKTAIQKLTELHPECQAAMLRHPRKSDPPPPPFSWVVGSATHKKVLKVKPISAHALRMTAVKKKCLTLAV